jgi:hypothetical protein
MRKKKNPRHRPKIRQGGNPTGASEHYTHAQQPSIQWLNPFPNLVFLTIETVGVIPTAIANFIDI